MKHLFLTLGLTLFSAGTQPALAEDEAGPLLENRMQISMDETGLHGPGAEWLNQAIQDNHFFIFGEQHATTEIAESGIFLFEMATKAGYSVAAIEVGPHQTVFVEDFLKNEGMEGYESYLGEGLNLLSVPFFSFREEAPLLMKAIENNPEGPALWGLDQEFIGASVVILEKLNSLAETDEEKAAVQPLLEQARQVPFIMGVMPAEAFAGLAKAFENSKNPEAKQLVEEIILTNRIYAPFTGRGGSVYLANDEREKFMKTNFLRHLSAHKEKTGEIPKVFLKFGASHASRGRSSTNVHALGNFVMEYGQINNLGTFNIHVDCFGGDLLNVQTGTPVPCQSYFLKEENPFHDNAYEEGMTLYNLVPLRADRAFLQGLGEEARNLVFAYDAILIIKNTTAASLFEGTLPDFGQ